MSLGTLEDREEKFAKKLFINTKIIVVDFLTLHKNISNSSLYETRSKAHFKLDKVQNINFYIC